MMFHRLRSLNFAPCFSIFDSDDAVFEIHDHVGGAVDFEEAADADDVRMPRRGGQVPEELRLLDELLEAERVDFLGIGIDRNDRVVLIPLADRAREIFFDRDKFVEIDAAALVDDAEAADAEDFLKPPFAQHRPRGQRLVTVGLVHRDPRCADMKQNEIA